MDHEGDEVLEFAQRIMSFIVNHQGKVYDCDPGEDTAKTAASLIAYQPDKGWTTVPANGVDEAGAE